MQRKIIKILFIFLSILILIVSFLLFFYKEEEPTYFDSINAIDISVSSDIFAVGINNANEREISKAKVARYDSKQEKIWEKVYNKGYRSKFNDIICDGDEIVFVGSYEATKKDYKNRIETAIILKYDLDGDLIFEKEFNGYDNTKFSSIFATGDGYVVVGTGEQDDKRIGVLVKYHTDGTLDWKKKFSEGDNIKFNDVIMTSDFIYVVGSKNTNQGLIAKYDMEGNLLDTVIHDGISSYGFSSVAFINSSLVVTTGKQVDDSKTDAMLVRYDLDLNYLNEETHKLKDSSFFRKVIVDSNQDLLVLGTAREIKKDEVIHHSFIGKYRSNLEKAQVVNYYNETDDYLTDIEIFDDNYLVSGYSFYSDQGYLSKFLLYSQALKLLEVK